MNRLDVDIRKLRPDAVIPEYKRHGDAGFDLAVVEDVVIPAGCAAILPTGLAVAIPEGYEMQIRLRSSVSLNTTLIIPNAPATVDSGYRGELGIIVRNLGSLDIAVGKGERIAQGVIARVFRAEFREREILDDSERGTGGYGSTGRY